MKASMIERIQITIEHAACILLAASAAFAASRGLDAALGQPQLTITALCLAALAYILCNRWLSGRRFDLPLFSLPRFEPAELQALEPDELLLTADMVQASGRPNEQEPLVLDDILAELGPDSRVVRLFDRSAMPTPGHLKARIDDHLGKGRLPAPAPDASQALSDALAELRRSLR
jgi:hypothetical protein